MRFEKKVDERYSEIKLLEEKLISVIAPQLKSEFIKINTSENKNIILDMSDVVYVDSSGLSAILTANRLCNNSGGMFVLCCLNSHTEKLIKISQLDTILNILPTSQEARDAIIMHELERSIAADGGEEKED